MIQVSNTGTGANLGEISEEELQILVLALEEEHSKDQAYWIDHAAVGGSEGVEIAYVRS